MRVANLAPASWSATFTPLQLDPCSSVLIRGKKQFMELLMDALSETFAMDTNLFLV
jgi:hypothetical protein